MDTKELSGLAVDELTERLQQTRKSLYELRVKAVTKEIQSTADIRKTRRDVARILQVLGDKRRGTDETKTAAKSK